MYLTKAEITALLEALSLLADVESFGIDPNSELAGFCKIATQRTAKLYDRLDAASNP